MKTLAAKDGAPSRPGAASIFERSSRRFDRIPAALGAPGAEGWLDGVSGRKPNAEFVARDGERGLDLNLGLIRAPTQRAAHDPPHVFDRRNGQLAGNRDRRASKDGKCFQQN